MSVKIVAMLKALPGLSREDFLRYWQDEHPALVWKLPGLRAYRQNPAIEHRKSWPYDGMAELYFDTVDDVRTAFASPQAEPLHAHEKHFLDTIDWFIATETTVEPVGNTDR
ncbi:EthD family reductase [Saccharopolyspora shandongensis]|uniref:EthD family reductase n=1 Tax=Saccharopolyspora shandongensis TaxID=418495 RepID=UPI003425531B